jgi:Tfp pilus assembly PilM family ATPase
MMGTIGLSISEDAVHIVAIARQGRMGTLTALAEWQNSVGITPDILQERIGAFLRANDIAFGEVSLALDTSQMFLHLFPGMPDTPDKSVREHAEWEIGQFFPDSHPAEFITDTHVMALSKHKPWREVLAVSVKRAEVREIRKVLSGLRLRIRIVDVDHFSAEHAFRLNYPERGPEVLALVGVKRGRIDISMLRDHELAWYSYSTPRSHQDSIDLIAGIPRSAPEIQRLVLYGPTLKHQMVTEVSDASSLPVEALNPFLQIQRSSSLLLADHFLASPYRFAAAVGAALREG